MAQSKNMTDTEQAMVVPSPMLRETPRGYETPRIEKRERLAEITGQIDGSGPR